MKNIHSSDLNFIIKNLLLAVTMVDLIACGNIYGKSSNRKDDISTKDKSNSGKGDSQGGTDGEINDAGFLKDDDFLPEKTKLSKDQSKSYLNLSQSAIEHIDSSKLKEKQEEDDDSSDCAEKIGKSLKSTPNTISLNEDKVTCSPNPEDPSEKQTIKITFKITCDKDGFNDVTWKKFQNLSILNHCQNGKLKYFYNISTTFKSKEGTSKYSQAFMTREGGPCTLVTTKSDFSIEDGCMSYTRHEFKGEKVSVRGQYKSAGGNFKKPVLNKGSLEVTMNNWKGTIKLNGDDPQLLLTSSQGDKINGSWSELTSRTRTGGKNDSE